MRLIRTDNEGTQCPSCGAFLRAEASWECDGEPHPEQNVKCPVCSKLLRVSQSVVTELEEVT